MSMGNAKATSRLVGTTAVMLLSATPIAAQQTAAPPPDPAAAPAPAAQRAAPVADASTGSNGADIIVTARKRQESLQNVPIVETVISSAQLQRTGTVDLKDLTKLAPGLMIGTAVLSVGTLVSIRGVGTSSSDPGIDQSVSLNIDGLSLGQGLAYSSGLFDVGQVEVLKGPQALFYGKGSPGGVISLRTADPTDKFELIARGGYETEAHQRRGELIVSGPITDTLKARVAGMYLASKGFYYNKAEALPGTGAVDPHYSREDRSRDYQIRGTLLWDPSSRFDARLKVNAVHDRAINGDQFQLTSCPDGVGAPLGIPFIGNGEDCKKDRTARVVDTNPANFPGALNNGIPFIQINQQYGTLELNYHPFDDITATSVTGYYGLQSKSYLNTSFTTYAGPLLGVNNPRFRRHDVTEEARVNSDYSGPLNFTAGGFYQDGKVSDRINILGNTAYMLPAIPLQDGNNEFTIRTYSAYGQVRWKVLPKVELDAGARYTDETRRETQTLYPSATFIAAGPMDIDVPTPRVHASNIAPEFTATYKPTDDLTLFASYKRGFKSGGFSIATPVSRNADGTYLDNSFKDERVQGFEGGIKGRLFDRQLIFSFDGYDYLYKGLQVGSIEPVVGSVPVVRTVNAGRGRVYGLELDATYQPRPIPGLSLNGSLDWTHARFSDLQNVPCYGGQTIAAGCNQELDPTTGLFFAQNLSGSRFIRAPNWQANAGLTYELPVGGDKKLIFNSSNHYTSKFLTTLGTRPDYFQKAFFKADLSLTLQGPRDRWEVSVIGKNVTEKLTASNCNNENGDGGLIGGQITGGTGRGPAGIDEVGCYMDPGRELWLQLTLRPFN
jgi:iron complex outermembrane receptor protein